MKGVILAGGTGSRLLPLTKVTNKHLLPVYDKPMIFYPLEKLIEAGCQEIMVVSGRGHAGHFLELLGSGSSYGVRLTYEIQDAAGGIAEALGLARRWAGDDAVAVILGDNIFEDSFRDDIQDFRSGGKIFLKEVPDANRFGVAEVAGDRVVGIEEKPAKPKSNLAVTGCYLYDNRVFEIIRTLEALGPGRARDHGREQRLHRDGRDAVLGPAGLLVRRRDLRLPDPGREHGPAAPEGPAGRALRWRGSGSSGRATSRRGS